MSRHSIIMYEPLFLQMVSCMDVRQVCKCARYWIGIETSDSENLCVYIVNTVTSLNMSTYQ